jgi:hypothetical protein
LIDSWLWFCLFLNYLYLVTLLNLKVSYAFMFCYSMRDKLKTIFYVFHMVETHTWLSLFHFSWSFVCVHFHVITWLLSFFYQDYIFHAHVLSSLISALNALPRWSNCDSACHLKNYSFVITYLLENEQELSLGMLIHLKRIYNFWCSMLVFTPFALCFVTLRGVFYAISGTNLLTRCHSASSLFSAVFVFQKCYTGNILGIGRNKF